MKSDHDRKHAQEYKRNCRKCSLRSWRDLRKSAVYIVFAAEEFRIVFAAEPREEWAQYGEEGRPCLPNILVKNIYIFPTVKSALLLLFKISSKYGPVKGRGREGEVFIKD